MASYEKISVHNGWSIVFENNIHMYYHSLKMTKGIHSYNIPCEDCPDGFLGIWLYNLNLEEVVFKDLLVGLREWAATLRGIEYKIYTSRDIYETNA
jgi:hypothetical protein